MSINTRINAELLNELREKYRLHLRTDAGQEQLIISNELQLEWAKKMKSIKKGKNKGACKVQSTDDVNLKLINNENIRRRITKIDIIKIGIPNMCHMTSQLFCDEEKNIKCKFGFNITACPCGKKMGYEIHSVNKIGDELFDFTKDFNGEKSKYFLETDGNITAQSYISLFGDEPFEIDYGCECIVRLGLGYQREKRTEEELLNHIEMLERCCFWN